MESYCPKYTPVATTSQAHPSVSVIRIPISIRGSHLAYLTDHRAEIHLGGFINRDADHADADVSPPIDFARFDGQYTFHAFFTLCKMSRCIEREATQTVVVDVKLDASATLMKVNSPQTGMAHVLVTPKDANKTPLGPGRADILHFSVRGKGKVQAVRDLDGKGTYDVLVNYDANFGRAALQVFQFGRPNDIIEVKLP